MYDRQSIVAVTNRRADEVVQNKQFFILWYEKVLLPPVSLKKIPATSFYNYLFSVVSYIQIIIVIAVIP